MTGTFPSLQDSPQPVPKGCVCKEEPEKQIYPKGGGGPSPCPVMRHTLGTCVKCSQDMQDLDQEPNVSQRKGESPTLAEGNCPVSKEGRGALCAIKS